jgi:hypothetical protein
MSRRAATAAPPPGPAGTACPRGRDRRPARRCGAADPGLVDALYQIGDPAAARRRRLAEAGYADGVPGTRSAGPVGVPLVRAYAIRMRDEAARQR